mgnify:CR=1 FL=1
MTEPMHAYVIGGGAAGVFGAIHWKERHPEWQVTILEQASQPLGKLRISGGGRCNVTHACFDPKELVRFYPRGAKELLGPFHRFQPRDTMSWFEHRGVALKIEADGRVFPVSDSSETIIDALLQAAKEVGILWKFGVKVSVLDKIKEGFWVASAQEGWHADKVLVATGGSPAFFALLKRLGHTIVELVPSLFTFNIPSSPFLDLTGISLEKVVVSLPLFHQKQRGPLLFTHWGLSGPAVLKLSSWAARELYAAKYTTLVELDFVPDSTQEEVLALFQQNQEIFPQKTLSSQPLFGLPKQLWKRLCGSIQEMPWRQLSWKEKLGLVERLKKTFLQVEGKTTYKQEFVTAGGVALSEIHSKTMESKIHSGLFFAGEVLNIDGVTGGFNFQNAWTTSWLAAHAP